MNEKKIEPTDAMVADVGVVKSWFGLTNVRDILGLALNHPDAAGLFECDHTDCLHVDEAATRLASAREEGWDDAVVHIYNKGWEGVAALRKANPHRPAQPLPPERDGVVLVPADGHESITTTDGQEFARLTFTTKQSIWYGPNLAGQLGDWVIQMTSPGRLIPGCWKVADRG